MQGAPKGAVAPAHQMMLHHPVLQLTDAQLPVVIPVPPPSRLLLPLQRIAYVSAQRGELNAAARSALDHRVVA